MWSFVQSSLGKLFGTSAPSVNAVLLGLDAAGKTTMLYKLKPWNEEVVTTIPTIGFNLETVQITNTNLTCWDVGGCDKIRPLWRHFTDNAHAIIFVVDASDRERIEFACDELQIFVDPNFINPTLPVLVFANKQDLPNTMPIKEIIVKLKLNSLRSRQWCVQPSCFTLNHGIKDGFEWLRQVLKTGSPAPTTATVEYIDRDRYFAAEADSSTSSSSSSATTSRGSGMDFFIRFKIPENEESGEQVRAAQEYARKERERHQAIYRRRETLNSWLQKSQEATAVSADDFLQSVQDFTLTPWDHYNHIRLAFEVTAKHHHDTKAQDNGSSAEVDMTPAFERIDELIEKFILNSPSTNGKSFHRTMTRFWATVIAHVFALTVSQLASTLSERIQFSDFVEELVHLFPPENEYADPSPSQPNNDHLDLTNGKLFALYYSHSVMFSAVAKAEIVPPDLKPLPLI